MYSYEEVLDFVTQEDVKFIRLMFFDVYGNQKNISIMSDELERAFKEGISFDASAIAGFGDEVQSDLFLHPDPSTISILPWRPTSGRVMRMYCDIKYPDERSFEKDCRYILKKAIQEAEKIGLRVYFGTEVEFYLFKTDENGCNTKIPFDNAGYMDIAPEDKGENVRREICLTLQNMGIMPESSHHEEGSGQHEIAFRHGEALETADNTATFKWVVKTIAARNGLYADFSPKPLLDESGNGMHINISLKSRDGKDYMEQFIAGIMAHIGEMTLFLNPSDDSYKRLGEKKAPRYITWSRENRSQLIRIPATKGGNARFEVRSPDPSTNPYIAFALLIHAGLDGVKRELPIEAPVNVNLYKADESATSKLKALPGSIEQARSLALESELIKSILPQAYLEAFEM